ncbi:DUF262 domain-containing protein [Aulosira sp. FACHB-615]|uniref:DUF262 domain-containing protein n=1 Tax=Aulosira sp. FACHB-615 TaxID=2692777 RepID=UPI0018F04A9B|nr:DUF262 domain-containing protein [Aulosira sp. FACHB-615]
MSTFDSTKTRLQTLLNSIVTGEIQLPDFQRGWVWDDEHIRSLLVSIARAFPVGAIMLLEAGGDAKFKARPVEGVDPTQATIDKLKKLLLDGQQRLTSLTQVLICTQPVQTRDSKKKLVQRYYYIDIETALLGPEHYESAIISIDADRIQKENFGRDVKLDLSTPEKEYEHFYFPCNQILNAGAWEVGLNQYDFTHKSNKLNRYMDFRTQVLDAFRYYELPIIELNRNNTKEAVCLVFEKVNTGGDH